MRTPRVLLAILILVMIYLAGMYPMQTWVANSVARDLGLGSLNEFDRRLAVYKGTYFPVGRICDAVGFFAWDDRAFRGIERQIPAGFGCMFYDFKGVELEMTPKPGAARSATDISTPLRAAAVEIPPGGLAVYLPRLQQAVIVADPATLELCQFLFEN